MERRRKRQKKTAAAAAEHGVEADLQAVKPTRPQVKYHVMGQQICRVALCRIHWLGMRTLTRVVGRVRGGQVIGTPTNRGSNKGYQMKRTKTVLRFIEQLAQEEGYPDPSDSDSKPDKPVISRLDKEVGVYFTLSATHG